MIPGDLKTEKTSWKFDGSGGFCTTFLGPKLNFFPVKTNKLLTPKGQSKWTCTNEVQQIIVRR